MPHRLSFFVLVVLGFVAPFPLRADAGVEPPVEVTQCGQRVPARRTAVLNADLACTNDIGRCVLALRKKSPRTG